MSVSRRWDLDRKGLLEDLDRLVREMFPGPQGREMYGELERDLERCFNDFERSLDERFPELVCRGCGHVHKLVANPLPSIVCAAPTADREACNCQHWLVAGHK